MLHLSQTVQIGKFMESPLSERNDRFSGISSRQRSGSAAKRLPQSVKPAQLGRPVSVLSVGGGLEGRATERSRDGEREGKKNPRETCGGADKQG